MRSYPDLTYWEERCALLTNIITLPTESVCQSTFPIYQCLIITRSCDALKRFSNLSDGWQILVTYLQICYCRIMPKLSLTPNSMPDQESQVKVWPSRRIADQKFIRSQWVTWEYEYEHLCPRRYPIRARSRTTAGHMVISTTIQERRWTVSRTLWSLI